MNRGRVTSSESCASPCTQSQPIRRRSRRVAVNPSPAQPSSSRPKSPHRTPVPGAGALHARAAPLLSSPRGLVADDRRHRRAPPPSPPCSPGEGKARVIDPSSSPFCLEISASPALTSVFLSSHADASRRRRTGSGRWPGPSAARRPPGLPGRRYSPRTLCLPCASVFRSCCRV